MFLLLWLQTIPSQTALSGANPISRRIAELSGCVGVCAHERTASSQWEQATLPTASPASPALQGPRKQSRQVLGETPSRKPSPYLGSPRARGLVRAALLLTAGSQRRACLLTRREGKSWEAETPAGLECLQPFLIFPRHGSPRAHTKFQRGQRPNNPQNQNQAALLLYSTEMRH